MKAFRYIVLGLSAAADIGLFFFGIMGLIAFAGDPAPSVPMAMLWAWTIGAVVLAGLTLWSFYRTARGKSMPLLYGFLLKMVTLLLVLGVTWFALDIPEAAGLALFLAALIGALCAALSRLADGIGSSGSTGRRIDVPVFRADKAKWAWDEAALEYFRLHGTVYDFRAPEQYAAYQDRIGAMADSETEQIYDYAGTPIAYFLGWLVQRNLVSEAFRQLHGAESVQAVREERESPLQLLRDMDYVLSKEDIAPDAQLFMVSYYEDGKRLGAYNSRSPKYFMDYYRAVCSGFTSPRYYCVDFTWESFHALAEILDRRFCQYSREGLFSDDYPPQERKLGEGPFGAEAQLCIEPGTSLQYVERCTDAYENMSESLRLAMAAALKEFCTEELPEDLEADQVLRLLKPVKVVVNRPVDLGPAAGSSLRADPVPAYVILGEHAWEPEHGVALTVIGDCVVSSTYYADAESPWQEQFMWKYRIRRDALNGEYVVVDKVPADFGGSGDPAEQLRVPLAAALCKKEMDLMVEALFTRGLANRYECKVTQPNYLFIDALKGEERVFADSIPLC